MGLLGKRLKVDFLPEGTAGIHILIAKLLGRIRLALGKIDEGFLISQA